MTAARIFDLGKAQKVAYYISANAGNLKIGDLAFCYLDGEAPLALEDTHQSKPGGGYGNICDAAARLLRIGLETRLFDENMGIQDAQLTPVFLRGLTPQEHAMESAMHVFAKTLRNNSNCGISVGKQAARRIVTLVNDAFDYSLGRGYR